MVKNSLLRKLAEDVVPSSLLNRVPKGFEVIGDIVILNLPRELEDYRFKIAEALLNHLKPRIRLVVRRSSPARDPERVHSYEILAGSGGFETLHRESGCVFKVDISKAFFTSRLQYERSRIASLVKPGEVIVNMFAGVGPFSIVIAKKVPGVKVYSIDINPEAYKLMVENVKLNKVEGKVIPLLGDAAEVIDRHDLRGIADRVLMPSPEHAINYLDKAIETLKSRGVVHYYDVAFKVKRLQDYLVNRISSILNGLGVKWEVRTVRAIRSVAPLKVYLCADVHIDRGLSQ
ncbi:MAG: class I SAM-dependent methyltransferase family protein [Candidatus Nezhaarchaeota archaeon]|nr:class I SAM-dependent methyltransferase family protein [Candidatus Nezhaarchaeota archaeon]